ncbi:tRNA1Val (adenine37-N6)-methyltransferase [Pedobacter westerhofensis]|uniref:tRNA1(Val) (adenine(37)-N6)-methyltransferase n=1 Tax=Pedobacter westerhofensis TaxID=425512 RepID=A0A521EAA3_9SPHI|nr:methyltransferase [Pedobacter westerhofensis]SMO80381.1 tRNA1Val (adenine37-N6)-methyltransferase [Pedobacter westerhofensis]
MGSIFKFKQFEVNQNGCAMKINTDGVLLGAIAVQQQPLHILDIGTGTGVIAMMMAQRYPDARIDAVEIDPAAGAAAAENFIHSPFADRMKAYPVSFEEFSGAVKYDLIVSNPPYFVNDLKNPEKRKQVARHAPEDFFEMLTRKSAAMLSSTGSLWMILPVKQAQEVIISAVLYQLHPARIVHIYSDKFKPEFRQIICLDFNGAKPLKEEHVYIYESQGQYTDQYKQLLKDFFLAF